MSLPARHFVSTGVLLFAVGWARRESHDTGVVTRIRFTAVVPQFTVPDVVRTAEYYRDVLGFHIAGVDAFAADVRARRAEIVEGPVLREYEQRELVIRDCNGLVLAFGEEVSRGL
jgi:hypothetical protein